MTIEEFQNSWVFKTGKKLLMKKFPWVIDVMADRDPDQYDSVVFVTIKIDVIKFMEDTGLNLAKWAENGLKRGFLTEASAICIFTDIECGDQRGRDIENALERELNKGRVVKGVPQEIKGGIKKVIKISSMILSYPITTEP